MDRARIIPSYDVYTAYTAINQTLLPFVKTNCLIKFETRRLRCSFDVFPGKSGPVRSESVGILFLHVKAIKGVTDTPGDK